jgi:hypothetical protein
MMTKDLDLADIQGNILQAFVSGYPAARFVFFRVTDAAKGRAFILDYRAKVTTALRWSDSGLYAGKIQATKPKVRSISPSRGKGFMRSDCRFERCSACRQSSLRA